MANLPPEILSALQDSNHYFITAKKDLIPLLAIRAIRVFTPQILPRDIQSSPLGQKIAARNASVTEGSIIVEFIGGVPPSPSNEVLLGPEEIPAFSAALRKLGVKTTA